MAIKKPKNGQTNYDMAMQLYGTLDSVVDLAISNGVTDLSILASEYTYNPNSNIRNSNFIGFPYSTDYNKSINICNIPYGLSTVYFNANDICFRFNNSDGSNYQYSYNTTGVTPTEWFDTSSSLVIIDGLTENVNYYIFVRTKCNSVLFSNPIHIQQVTTPGGYFETEDGGLIFETEDGEVFKNEA